jgi:acetate---CoA ligase (ADP-forming)
VRIPDSYRVRDVSDLAAGWDAVQPPVVLKVEAAGLAHKTEIGGVAMGINGIDDLERQATAMVDTIARSNPDVGVDGFLVQSQITDHAVECLVGVVRDPQVGLVLSVVPGGVLAELGGTARCTPIPASRSDVEFLIDSSPLGRLLDGYRGAPRADRDALVDLVSNFGEFVHRCGPDVAEAEINPVLVLPEGSGAVAVDGLFVTAVHTAERVSSTA